MQERTFSATEGKEGVIRAAEEAKLAGLLLPCAGCDREPRLCGEVSPHEGVMVCDRKQEDIVFHHF